MTALRAVPIPVISHEDEAASGSAEDEIKFVPIKNPYIMVKYREVDLLTLELQVGTEANDYSIVFDDGTEMVLSEKGFESLCKLLGVPLGFAKKLAADGKTHVLEYLQKQLSRTVRDSVFAVHDGTGIAFFLEKSDLIIPADKIPALDEKIIELGRNVEFPYQLVSRDTNAAGDVYYYFDQGTQVMENDILKSEYTWESFLHYSAYGYHRPYFGQRLTRKADGATWLMHSRPKYLEATTYDNLVLEVLDGMEGLDKPSFEGFRFMLDKLNNAAASLREVKEARQKITKLLKADKDDHETPERIEKTFMWKKIVKAFSLREIVPKPSKKWFASAASPHTLFYVYSNFVRELTHAPNTVDSEFRLAAMRWSYKMLDKVPDLAESSPPKVDWYNE